MIRTNFYKSLIVLFVLMALMITVTPSHAMCIKATKANLRMGPGTDYKILFKVFKYMPLKKLKRKGDWYRVQDVDGDIYWVHRKLTTNNFKCAVIKNDETNLRIGPGTKFEQPVWSPVKKYFSVKVVKQKENWVKVLDETGDQAWVYRPLIWIQ
jgi:SH3-like domain-containing protein